MVKIKNDQWDGWLIKFKQKLTWRKHHRVTRAGGRVQHLVAGFADGVLPWFWAALGAAAMGSMVQSSNNLLRLTALDAPVTWRSWLITMGHDITCFMPFYLLVVGAGFLLAFPVATAIAKIALRLRHPLFVAAGVVAAAVAIGVTNRLAPVPTLIPAAREWPGYLALLGSGALGGWVFGRCYPQPLPSLLPASALLVLLLPIAVLGGSYGLHALARPDRAQSIADYDIANARLSVLADGLEHPWSMVMLPDGRKLVTERAGRMRIITADGKLLQAPVSGVPPVLAGGQGGLMDVKAARYFEQNHLIFFTYACGTVEANNTCVGRGELHGNELKHVQRIFQAQPLKHTGIQYGSRITLLPDETLLVSVGDGFDYREQAQDLTTHYGKVLRLNADGSAPGDNPFAGQPDHLPEIFSYGHRNPQGIWFDPQSERVYLSDHGPYGGDEVNVLEAGRNYGWPLVTDGINYAGDYVSPFATLPGLEDPIHHWTPSIAPADMLVYRGRVFPEMEGDLLVASLGGHGVFRLRLARGRVVQAWRMFHDLSKRIRQVTVDSHGNLYLLTDHAPGQVLKVSR